MLQEGVAGLNLAWGEDQGRDKEHLNKMHRMTRSGSDYAERVWGEGEACAKVLRPSWN